MARKRYKPEEIVSLLRQAEVLHGQGMSMADAIRQLGISEVTFYRWRKEYAGMSGDRLRRLCRHQAPADRVTPREGEHHPVKRVILGPKRCARRENRDHDRLQDRVPGDELADPCLEAGLADHADLEAEGLQYATQLVLQILNLALQQLPAGQENAAALARRRLHVNRLVQPDAHHLPNAQRIVPVGLVDLRR